MAGGSLGIYQAAGAEVLACAGLRLSPDNCKATDWGTVILKTWVFDWQTSLFQFVYNIDTHDLSFCLSVCLSVGLSINLSMIIYAQYIWLCWPSDWRMSQLHSNMALIEKLAISHISSSKIHDLPFDRQDRVWASCCKTLQILAERCCHQSSVEPTFAEIVNLKEISSGVNWSKAMATLPIFWEVSHSLPDLGAPFRGLPEAAVSRHAWEDVDAWEFCIPEHHTLLERKDPIILFEYDKGVVQ